MSERFTKDEKHVADVLDRVGDPPAGVWDTVTMAGGTRTNARGGNFAFRSLAPVLVAGLLLISSVTLAAAHFGLFTRHQSQQRITATTPQPIVASPAGPAGTPRPTVTARPKPPTAAATPAPLTTAPPQPMPTSRPSPSPTPRPIAHIAEVQSGPTLTVAGNTLTVTLGVNSTAGTMLAVQLAMSASSGTFSGPAGWQRAVTDHGPGGTVEIWYYAGNPGGVTSASFTSTVASGGIWGAMTEWSGVATASAVDQTGSTTALNASASGVVSTTQPTKAAGELALTFFDTSGTQPALAAGAGWAHVIAKPGLAADEEITSASGTIAETEGYGTASSYTAVIATFLPATPGQ